MVIAYMVFDPITYRWCDLLPLPAWAQKRAHPTQITICFN